MTTRRLPPDRCPICKRIMTNREIEQGFCDECSEEEIMTWIEMEEP